MNPSGDRVPNASDGASMQAAAKEAQESDAAPAHSSLLTIAIVAAIVAAVVVSILLPLLPGTNWVNATADRVVTWNADGSVTATPLAADDAAAEVSRPWKQILVHDILGLGGEIFLNVLFMLVVPLVVTSVMAGILSLGDVRKLGRPGLYAILYYVCTTVLAVTVGLVLANIFKPGVGAQVEAAGDRFAEVQSKIEAARSEGAPQSVGETIRGLVETIFTDNLVVSAAEQQLLPLIVFSILFAAILTTREAASRNLRAFIVEAADALMAFVMFVMKFAPLGIFCLVAGRFGEASLKGEFVSKLSELGWYAATVTTGLMVHALITLPLIYWMVRGENPYRFLVNMGQALLTAFGTSSSSATLPVTIETATENAGVSKKAAGFVLPLGATINMDGTALYEATAALFIAQLSGMDLGLGQQVVIAITATLAAIGAAGVPEAGLVTMLIVLKAVGLKESYIATIIPIDWLLDRVRTTVNVFGDATGAAVLTPQLPDEPPAVVDASALPGPTLGGLSEGATTAALATARMAAGEADTVDMTPDGAIESEPSETVELRPSDLDARAAARDEAEPEPTQVLPQPDRRP